MLPIGNRSLRQVSDPVSAETANSRNLAQKQSPAEALREFSTRVRSASRNPLRSPGVICIPSSVALRKRTQELRTPQLSGDELSSVELRTVELSTELRKSVLRTPMLRNHVSAYPTASPKSTLAGVFENMKRAARSKKSQRIGERLATQVQSAYQRPRNSVPVSAS